MFGHFSKVCNVTSDGLPQAYSHYSREFGPLYGCRFCHILGLSLGSMDFYLPIYWLLTEDLPNVIFSLLTVEVFPWLKITDLVLLIVLPCALDGWLNTFCPVLVVACDTVNDWGLALCFTQIFCVFSCFAAEVLNLLLLLSLSEYIVTIDVLC